ncbi:MAG TPA: type I DNA topoisomerase [Spirochaetia bacterium]|nr:type I DNA topoisomerase [Spirochaetia bacterium]
MADKKVHTLLIVESPAKAKTIEKYLGKGYTVEASMGHLIDLPKSRLAIDVDNSFEPEYITVRGKAKILKELTKKAKKAGHVLLASDNDREGEAISYHLQRAFLAKSPNLDIERIVFNEITPAAIKEAVSHPSRIDDEKVSAQKARRVLDRIVGYHLSPILWKKVKNGLSAGRVQSVALRLICEREAEVEAFIPEEYWTLDAEFSKGKISFRAQLVKYGEQKAEIKDETSVQAIVASLAGKTYAVVDMKESEKTIRPKPPFTTSQLQQSAANRLGYTSKKTMQIAQQLYEGVNIGSNRIGLITYMRTDSTRVAQSALDEVRKFIGEKYAAELPAEANSYSMGKGAQDAHEAIRPTVITYTPDDVKDSLTKDQLRLYSIIWERFISSQMTPAKTKSVSVDIGAGDCVFRVTTTKVVEKGFQRVLKLLGSKEKSEKIPSLTIGEELALHKLYPEQHYTSGPPRFTDASIVKTLEEKGIGRPSTYAPIISVLLDRYYVVRKNKQLVATPLGRIINDILTTSFPDVLNVNFTADMERRLDMVEESREEWVEMIRTFYQPFKHRVDHVMATLESVKGVMDEETDYVCEKCGRKMVKKLGRYGFFLACSGFPECMNTKSVPLADCPRPGCDGKIVARKKQGGRGKEFYGCTNYPTCDFISHFKPTSSNCPKCGWFLVEKSDKRRGSYKSCINPDCDHLHSHEEEEEEALVGAEAED